MAKTSSSEEQGVPSFSYSLADSRAQAMLFEFSRPIDDLQEMLLTEYASRTITMRKLYEEHSVDRPFLAQHYKVALREMEKSGDIEAFGRRSNRGFADAICVRFPPRR